MKGDHTNRLARRRRVRILAASRGERLPPGEARARWFHEVAGIPEAMLDLEQPIVSADGREAEAHGVVVGMRA